jgi:hypothetical protein
MAELAADRVLSTWERAAAGRGHERALALLAHDGQGDGSELPLGLRDARLLLIFGAVRGSNLDALADCPECGTTLELQLAIADLVDGYPDRHGRVGRHDVDLGTAAVRVRCPTTGDLVAAAGAGDADAARDMLVERCVTAVRRPAAPARALDDDELRRLGEHLERLDPLVDVRIEISCDECHTHWPALLDVPGMVWAQIEGLARRLLRDVDALATRYGWSEADILGMSEARRHAYLDLP